MIVISLALYVITALPITSFRLKRMLLNLTPTDAAEAGEHRGDRPRLPRARASTATSAEAFEALGVPPPREIPFDLIAQATLMLLPLLLGVSLAIANLDRLATGAQVDSR